MRQTFIKKLSACLASVLLIFTCVACKAAPTYLVKDYLNTLAIESGIGDSQDIVTNYKKLLNWGVVTKEEIDLLNTYLNYEYLSLTITRLIEKEEKNNLLILKNLGWIDLNINKNQNVDKDTAEEIIKKAVDYINNKEFEEEYYIEEKEPIKEVSSYKKDDIYYKIDSSYVVGDYIYLKDENKYKKVVGINEKGYLLEDAEFEEVIKELNISNTFDLDLSNAVDIPSGTPEYEETNYVNTSFNLLASKNDTKTFNSAGFKVAYKLKRSGIDVRISKSINGVNVFTDISLSNIKPSYKWNYKENESTDSYFKVDYKSTIETGVSVGKYNKTYLKLKDLDSSSFMNAVKSICVPEKDRIEAIIPICTVKTPIPNVPVADLCLTLLAKVYITGKVELVIYNNNSLGFETKNGSLRLIKDINRDIDLVASATASACLGVNFGLEATSYRLMDIEVDAGVKTYVKPRVHLYDEDGNDTVTTSEIPYYVLDEASNGNEWVKICGDVSLNWQLNLLLNTSKTILYKYGFSYDKAFLDDDNQILGNLTHIENGSFVKSCTRKKKTVIKSTTTTEKTNAKNKIILSKYSVVIDKGEVYNIDITNLPSGYTKDDLIYSSNETSVATVSNGQIKALASGAAKITISTKDNKYTAYINILVRTS